MSTAMPAPVDPTEQATGPGWPGEDHERDALLSQDSAATYQGGGLEQPPDPGAGDPTTAAATTPAPSDWARA